jgi:hypothetical protein
VGSREVVGSTETVTVMMGSGVTVADSEAVVASSLAVEVGCAVGEVTSEEGVGVGSSLTVYVSCGVGMSEVVVNWNVDVSVVAEDVEFEDVRVETALEAVVSGAEEVTFEKGEV